VDIELLDGTLDNALDDVVEAEAVHEATDGAGLQVENAGGLTLAADDATDSAGSKAEDRAGLTLDNVVNSVAEVQAVGKTTNEARVEAKGLVSIAVVANNVADGTRAKVESVTRVALDNIVDSVAQVQAVGKTTNEARVEAEGLVSIAVVANNVADGARAKVEGVARVALDDVVNSLTKAEAVGKTTNEARVKTEGLVSLAVTTNNRADGTGAEVKGVARVALDDVVDGVAKVEAVGEATDEAGVKTKGLVGVAAAAAENGASSAGSKVEGVARVTLDDLADAVAKVEAVGEATDEAGVKTKSLVGVAVAAAEDRADGTGAKVQGVAGVTLDDLVDNVVGVQAVGEATNKAGVKTKSLVGVAAVATEDRADGTGAKVQGRAGVTLEAKVKGVDGVGDAVEERGDGTSNDGKVTLDDGKVAKSLVEVEAGEEAVDESIALDDAADSLSEAEGADEAVVTEKAVEEVALGGNIDIDVVDDVLDLADKAALGDVQAADSVEEAVNGTTDTAANKTVDEVAGLDTDLDAVDSVLDAVDGSRDTAGKGVVDDAALDTEAEARDNGKAAGDGVDVDNIVKAAKSLTLGGHGKGGGRKGQSDESVLHLEKGVCVLTKVVSW